MTEPALAPLRLIMVGGTPGTLSDAYHRIFPFDAFTDAIACPACGCTKSGDLLEANHRTEACDDSACPCHNEGACVTCAHDADDCHTADGCVEPGCVCAPWSEMELRYAHGDR